MRRILMIIVALLAVSACTEKSPLPSEEVLSRAAGAVPNLLSARFDASIDIEGTISDQEVAGEVTIKGRMQDAGSQMQFVIDGDGDVGKSTLKGSVEWIILPSQEVYANIYALSIDPLPVFFPFLQNMIGQWIQISEGNEVVLPVTPDPRLLRAQSQVIAVIKDHGLVSVRDRKAYHYTVALDPEKLVEFLRATVREGQTFDEASVRSIVASIRAKGELWIDTETFHIHRIEWDIEKTDKEETVWDLTAEIEIYDHNSAPPITPPADALPLFENMSLTPVLDEDVLQSLLKSP